MKLKPVATGRRAAREQVDIAAPAAATAMPMDAGPSDIRGLIDNATTDRLYGWAWDANHPGTRLKVELRLAGDVVATTIADFVRPDLAKNGVGDGCHAFEFPLTPEWVDRRAELMAVALGADGAEFPIAVRIRRLDDGQVANQLQRAVEAMTAELQGIRAEFAEMRARADLLPEAAAVAAIDDGQAELRGKVQSLELWLARLDGKLGDTGKRADPIDADRRLDPWQAVAVAALASAACSAAAIAVARFVLF